MTPATIAVVPARVLGVELLDELRAVVRDPATMFFSVAMPVGFYALFVTMFGSGQVGGLPVGTSMLATFGAYGAVAVTLLNPGIGVAEDRGRGWLRVKKASAVPVATTLAAKVLATLPYSLAVLVAMTAVWMATAGGGLDVATWARLVGVLVLGALPFALLGLAYHLAQLALAQLTGAGVGDHVLVLLLTTLVTASLAGLAYRKLRV